MTDRTVFQSISRINLVNVRLLHLAGLVSGGGLHIFRVVGVRSKPASERESRTLPLRGIHLLGCGGSCFASAGQRQSDRNRSG